MFQVVKKLKLLKRELKDLHRNNFSNIIEEAAEDRNNLRRCQEALQQDPLNAALQEEEKIMGEKFRMSNYKAEMMMQQRSKANWLRAGDDNTKYFFSIMKQRKLAQIITQIEDQNSQVQHEPERIAEVFVEYYKELLGRKGERMGSAEQWFLKNGYRIDTKQQGDLLEPYTSKDVKEAIWGINVNKSPGPDGYGSGFSEKLGIS
ncbi:PREDICTED: uncharacterized protein LOC109222008 [Nicotiana attenuata]|uniref:uncharacterized protein LOC109222008 n=1 Tax=Nicotiana attenuata TaxID=49451 RepID=UPI000905BC9F|nr:PREDICTED: uncharacterized protein LOC109222008 [Nicotiana attenuata]